MRRLPLAASLLAPSLLVLAGCNGGGRGSGEASFSSSGDPNDTIAGIKSDEAQLESELEAGRREAEGTWGDDDPGYQRPGQMGFQPP